MKFIKQFGIILSVTFAGEILRALIPLPVPAGIYGLVLLLAALLTGIVKADNIRHAADILIEIMPMMFIPAAAGIVKVWPVLQPVLIPIVIITVVSTVMVMGIAGRVTQRINRLCAAKEGEKQDEGDN